MAAAANPTPYSVAAEIAPISAIPMANPLCRNTVASADAMPARSGGACATRAPEICALLSPAPLAAKIIAISAAYYELSRVLVFLETRDTLTLDDVREVRTLVSAANSKLQTLELLLVGGDLPKQGD